MSEKEEILSMDTGTKEASELPSVLFIYRDNDLYKSYIPNVLESLRASGRKVESQIFPRGTDFEIIKTWVGENTKNLEMKQIMFDNICHNAMSSELRKRLDQLMKEKIGVKAFSGGIDDALDFVTDQIVLGDRYSKGSLVEEQSSYESAGKVFSFILNKILENKKNIPESVYILKSRLIDHRPFNGGQSEISDPPKEELVYNELLSRAIKELKQWLINGGIPEDKIFEESDINSGNEEMINKTGSWILADRHSLSIDKEKITGYNNGKYFSYPHRAKLLSLPVSNFYISAKKEGLLEVPEKEFEIKLADYLKDKLDIMSKDK